MENTALAAQEALVGILKDGLDPDAYDVSDGIPFTSDLTEHTVAVGESIEPWKLDNELTSSPQDEAFMLHVYLYLRRTNASAAEMRELVDAAFSAVKALLQDNYTLSGTVDQAFISAGQYASSFWDEAATVREGQMRLDIGCARFG